jgi:hypothetical protein
MGLLVAGTPTATAGDKGEPCEGDINGDAQVNVLDILEVVSNFGACPDEDPCPADANGDGTVDVNDLLIVIDNFGPCDGPGCESSEDCDDGDPCTVDICIQGSCFNIPLPDCE